ncbi:hypothetical protein F5Y04DRAFT_289763 [Hypomontagnella monticulosa]|nr:hypothetical protein F5Y04DRAFT_289763 [Hypomontagnella monticulosa]
MYVSHPFDSQLTTNSHRADNEASIDLLEGSSDDKAALLRCPVLAAAATATCGASTVVTSLEPVDDLIESANITSPVTATKSRRTASNNRMADYSDSNISGQNKQLLDTASNSPPSPLQLPAIHPAILIRRLAGIRPGVTPTSELVKANFIVSHLPEVAAGVVEATHKELARTSSSARPELRRFQDVTYLQVTTRTRQVAELINAAQSIVDDLTSDDSTRGPGVFQEPPAELTDADQVMLDIDDSSGSARPRLQPGQGVDNCSQRQLLFQEYATALNNRVWKDLKKAGRLPLSLTLRVRLGYGMLRSYPQDKLVYRYHDFHKMMQNPRASGDLKTWIGNEALVRHLLNSIRNDPSTPFQPIGNQVASAANVLPEYSVEIRSQRVKFDVPIRRRSGGNVRGSTVYQMCRLNASKLDANLAEVDILNISPGRNLDWKLEAIDEEKDAKSFPDVTRYLKSAKMVLSGEDQSHDIDVYPRVQLSTADPVAGKIKYVTVKTVYQFRWKATSYITQIAVNHRWSSIPAMNAGKAPTIDLEINVFGEFWDGDDDAVGNIWGDELQLLLDAGDSSTTSGSADRVDIFIQTIKDIRNAIESFF